MLQSCICIVFEFCNMMKKMVTAITLLIAATVALVFSFVLFLYSYYANKDGDANPVSNSSDPCICI